MAVIDRAVLFLRRGGGQMQTPFLIQNTKKQINEIETEMNGFKAALRQCAVDILKNTNNDTAKVSALKSLLFVGEKADIICIKKVALDIPECDTIIRAAIYEITHRDV